MSEAATPLTVDSRKLWLDYLGRLNDREIRSANVSGATTWVVIAAMAGIIYDAAARFPQFLSSAPDWTHLSQILLLQVNATYFAGLGIVYSLYYCIGETEGRVDPPLQRRAGAITRLVSMWLSIALLLGNIYVTLVGAGLFPRLVCGVLALLLGGASVIAARTYREKRRKEKEHHLDLPDFTLAHIPPSIAGALGVVFFVIALIAGAALLSFLMDLHTASVAWLGLVGASSRLLAIVMLASLLLYRLLRVASRGVFRELERDILLYDLGGADIRSRFIAEIIGPAFGEWFTDVVKRIEAEETRLKDLVVRMREGLAAVKAIEPKFMFERSGRAQTLLDDADSHMQSYRTAWKAFRAEMPDVTKIHVRKSQLLLIVDAMRQLGAYLERADKYVDEIKKLRDELRGLATPSGAASTGGN